MSDSTLAYILAPILCHKNPSHFKIIPFHVTRRRPIRLRPTSHRYIFWRRCNEYKFSRIGAPNFHSLLAPNTLIEGCSHVYPSITFAHVWLVTLKYTALIVVKIVLWTEFLRKVTRPDWSFTSLIFLQLKTYIVTLNYLFLISYAFT